MNCSCSYLELRGNHMPYSTLAARFGEERRGYRCVPRKGMVARAAPFNGGAKPLHASVCAQVSQTSDGRAGTWKRSFVEPSCLLPLLHEGSLLSTISEKVEENTSGRSWPMSCSGDLVHLQNTGALYDIMFATSKDEKSSLSDANSGILVSMISEDGKALLQRIPGVQDMNSSSSTQQGGNSSLRFQRGSVDRITFSGPYLGRLAALWIAPEAGTWKIAQVSVAMIPSLQEMAENCCISDIGHSESVLLATSDMSRTIENDGKCMGLIHVFEGLEALIGEGAYLAAAQLKPSLIQECFSKEDCQEKIYRLIGQVSNTVEEMVKLRDDGLKEYDNLKLSLLGITSALGIVGTIIFVIFGLHDMAKGFATGDLAGLLYLALLQRAVDLLPSPAHLNLVEGAKSANSQVEMEQLVSSENPGSAQLPKQEKIRKGNGEGPESNTSRMKNKITVHIASPLRVALATGIAVVLSKLAQGSGPGSFIPPQALLAAILGFLTSKIAVVLVASRSTGPPKVRGK